MSKPELGQHVLYTDERGKDHDSLVTAVWSETCINCLFVSSDETKRDDYGRQIERPSSVTKGGPTSAHGRYWRFTGEDKIPVKPGAVV